MVIPRRGPLTQRGERITSEPSATIRVPGSSRRPLLLAGQQVTDACCHVYWRTTSSRSPHRQRLARDDPEATAVSVGQCYRIEGMLRLPRLRHDLLGGPMQRGRALFWTSIGSLVAVVAVVIALILVNSGAPPKAASSPAPSISARASSPAGESAPVVIPKTSSTSSFSYLSDLVPSGNLGELVNPGPVKIDGSIYPKSISFYCNVGDPTAFPAYKLKHNARRFQATIGFGAKFPPQFEAAVILVGDGHTLQTFTVSAPRPETVDVNVTGVHTLQLQCFGSGQSSSAGWAVSAAWGNARFVERH